MYMYIVHVHGHERCSRTLSCRCSSIHVHVHVRLGICTRPERSIAPTVRDCDIHVATLPVGCTQPEHGGLNDTECALLEVSNNRRRGLESSKMQV